MTKKILIVLVLVLAAVGVYKYYSSSSLLGANECASGQTCLPSLELTGPNSGVTNSLQIDTGLASVATTTVTGPLKLKGLAPSCIELFATSTATIGKLTFTASSTVISGSIVGFMTYSYGACPS